jgi:hypothetical protein
MAVSAHQHPRSPPKKQPPKTSAPEDFVKGGKTPAAPRCKNRFAPVALQQHVVKGIRKFNPYASDITQKMETTAILARIAPCPPLLPAPAPEPLTPNQSAGFPTDARSRHLYINN